MGVGFISVASYTLRLIYILSIPSVPSVDAG
jgi:hypothetical protein